MSWVVFLPCTPHFHTLHTFMRFTPFSPIPPCSAIHPMQAVTVDTETAVLARSLRSGEQTLVQEPQVCVWGVLYEVLD